MSDNTQNRHVEAAAARFAEGFNCCQAVVAAYAERFGLDAATAVKLGAGFGGGMGRQALTCGAVTGAFMVLGLSQAPATADPAAKEAGYARVREFTHRFQALHGSIACRELAGCDISQPDGLQQAKDSGVFKTRCPAFVRDAAAIVGAML